MFSSLSNILRLIISLIVSSRKSVRYGESWKKSIYDEQKDARMLGISLVFSDILAILVIVLKFPIALVQAFDANSKKNFEESIKM